MAKLCYKSMPKKREISLFVSNEINRRSHDNTSALYNLKIYHLIKTYVGPDKCTPASEPPDL